MCGIAGYFRLSQAESSVDGMLRMLRSIAHRGPDDEGIALMLPETDSYLDFSTVESAPGVRCAQVSAGSIHPHRIAFAHRRFSIIDVSQAGHQPFWSRDRRACVCFNGEIYNYLELREDLAGLGHHFSTESDTEVLVEAYLEWGVECFRRLNGFWALSLYDADRKSVLLSRDRIGKAPLYVAQTSTGLVWASEIKALWALLGQNFWPIREQAVSDFVLRGWRDVFHETFYEGIATFPNAAFAWVAPDGSYNAKTYWELPDRRWDEGECSVSEAAKELRRRLLKAVQLRLRADVPVGLELSGGMDSSALAALAAQSVNQVQAFTVSFPGTAVDEEPFARKVVERYPAKIRYSVLHPPQEDFFQQADSYVWLLEEPFHSPNLLTNQGIWREMRRGGIRVSLNGAAGDETLAGYSEYREMYLQRLARQGNWTRLVAELFLSSEIPDEFSRTRRMMDICRRLPTFIRPTANRETKTSNTPFLRPTSTTTNHSGPSLEICQRLLDDMGHWRMNYWMRSGNKSAMGVPLEVRAPFLDCEVLDLAFRLPIGYLIRNGWLKWILRESVKDLLPEEVVWRKTKMGFPFPYSTWLTASKKPFFSMVESLDCPYIDLLRMRASYDQWIRQDPLFLWRLMSVALWWKRCVRGDSLA